MQRRAAGVASGSAGARFQRPRTIGPARGAVAATPGSARTRFPRAHAQSRPRQARLRASASRHRTRAWRIQRQRRAPGFRAESPPLRRRQFAPAAARRGGACATSETPFHNILWFRPCTNHQISQSSHYRFNTGGTMELGRDQSKHWICGVGLPSDGALGRAGPHCTANGRADDGAPAARAPYRARPRRDAECRQAGHHPRARYLDPARLRRSAAATQRTAATCSWKRTEKGDAFLDSWANDPARRSAGRPRLELAS